MTDTKAPDLPPPLTYEQQNSIWQRWTDKHPTPDWRSLVRFTEEVVRAALAAHGASRSVAGDPDMKTPQQGAGISLPPLPAHPEPHTYRWTQLEEETIGLYGQQCAQVALDFAAALAAPKVEAPAVAEDRASTSIHNEGDQS